MLQVLPKNVEVCSQEWVRWFAERPGHEIQLLQEYAEGMLLCQCTCVCSGYVCCVVCCCALLVANFVGLCFSGKKQFFEVIDDDRKAQIAAMYKTGTKGNAK